MNRLPARIACIGIALALSLFAWTGPAAAAGGDVTVGAVDGTGGLRINGDTAGNDITVTQNADSTVTVTGNGGTTVNGKSSVTTTKAVTGKLKVNTRGGDDKVTVTGVKSTGLEVKDEIGKNDITIKKCDVGGKIKIRNESGKIKLDDVKWKKRDIRKGKGTIDPPAADGKGGAGSAPPKGTSSKKARAAKKAAKKAGKAPLEAQQHGLPTSNPGQRGLIPNVPSVPEVPHHPTPSFKGGSPKWSGPKGKYP